MESHRVEGIDLVLSHPDELDVAWVGQTFVQEQLLAAWMRFEDGDLPLNPRILGHPGVGKTSLAYATAKKLNREVYIVQATMDTRPEDLLITPVLAGDGKLRYHASGLVTAMIRGGVCILDEGNRMTEKSWASLAALLDTRRYVESVVAGVKIHAHRDFLFCTTMNEDASTFELPEYIHSRLQPRIQLDFPEKDEELAILRANLPWAEEDLLEYVACFLERAHKADERFTVRDGINIGRFALKIRSAQEGGAMGSIPEPRAGATTEEKRLRAVARDEGFDIDRWFRTALEGILDPAKAKAGAVSVGKDGKVSVAVPGAAPDPDEVPSDEPKKGSKILRIGVGKKGFVGGATVSPPRPLTPLYRAIRHATLLTLGDEALQYLDSEDV